MKQYTNESQTTKLIELGFEKPNGLEFLVREKDNPDNAQIIQRIAYSIGELIEMLPAKIDGVYCNIDRCGQRSWAISYDPMIYCCNCAELVDALYDMCVQLKEEGVI